MIGAVDAKLDHLAVAAETWADLWPRYRGDLGGEWVSGGPTWGFASAQVRYANGMKLEVLEPFEPEKNDFLRRFLDRRGPGPHHLTFKVPNLEEALAATEAAGYRPVGVDMSDPHWKEAFLHPKDAPGVVIQLAQAAGEWESPPPADLPAPRVEAATFSYVGHAVASFGDGIRLYRDLLSGEEAGEGHDALLGADWIAFAWSSGGVVRLFEGAGEPGVHHAAFATVRPRDLAGAEPAGDGRYEIVPAANLGLRLLLTDA